MKTIAIAAAAALVSCAPTPGPAEAPPPPPPAADQSALPPGPVMGCATDRLAPLVGRPVDQALRGEAQRLSGLANIRVLAPGAAATMDYRTDRLNIDTDASNRATRFYCG